MFLTAVMLLTATHSAPLPPDSGREARLTFENKLPGEWEKGGACIGDITIRSNGTFERRHYGPGNKTLSGTWKLNWDAAAPTLLLTCDESNSASFVGRTWELKVTRLDVEVMNWESGGQTAGRFKRKQDGVESP